MIVVNKHASLFWFRAKRFKFDELKIEVVMKTTLVAILQSIVLKH
jgi:hypothetical protein